MMQHHNRRFFFLIFGLLIEIILWQFSFNKNSVIYACSLGSCGVSEQRSCAAYGTNCCLQINSAGCTYPSCTGYCGGQGCPIKCTWKNKQRGWVCKAQCPPKPSCNAGAPSITSVTSLSSTSSQISWTPGANTAGTQSVYADPTLANVQSNCTNVGGCKVEATGLSAGTTSYTANGLTPGTIYYWMVVNYQNASCLANSGTTTSMSSCALSPSSATIPKNGTTQVFTDSAVTSGLTVNFSGNASYITENPASDGTSPYQTTVTGVSSTLPGSTNLTANVYQGATLLCSSTAAVTVVPPGPWWQVRDGDVTTNGDLNSQVPPGQFFDLIGAGGYPGIPAYAGLTNLQTTNVSVKGWIAASMANLSKTFDYNFFSQAIPSDVNDYLNTHLIGSSTLDQATINANVTQLYGYYWYKYDGSTGATNGLDLTINGPINLGGKRVILLVNSANLLIKGPINLTKGQGFFMVIAGADVNGAKGNITVDPSVGGGALPNLEGIYFSDGQFDTGSLQISPDVPLYIRGSVAANGGVILNRDLGDPANGTTPAELFEFAPDQILLFPSKLGERKINWKEVNP